MISIRLFRLKTITIPLQISLYHTISKKFVYISSFRKLPTLRSLRLILVPKLNNNGLMFSHEDRANCVIEYFQKKEEMFI